MQFVNEFLSYGIIGLMVSIFIGVGYKYIIIPKRSIKNSQKEIIHKLTELQQTGDISTRFIEFEKWLESQPKTSYLEKAFMPAWKGYYKKFLNLKQNGVVFTPDVYDFFVEDSFVNKYGNRKLVEVIPGIFLALGIVGTFLGIAIGVSGLDTTGTSEDMQDGIGVLLGGMKIKFASSIVGILLSAIWQLLDKTVYYPKLTKSFLEIRQVMDETFPTQEESTVLYQMYKNQEKQITDFQLFLSDVMIPNMVSGISQTINQSLTPHLEQTQAMMSDMMKNTTANQVEGINTMVDHFVSSLSEITGDHMKGLGEALQTTIEWQKRVHDEMSELVESMQESAKGQSLMVEKTTVLTEQVHGFTERLTDYQSVFENTISQLNETTEKNNQLHTAISDLLERMTEERVAFDKVFSEHITALNSNVDLVISQTGIHTELHNKFEANLEKINTLTQEQQALTELLSNQSALAVESNSTVEGILQQVNNHSSLFTQLQTDLKETLDYATKERQKVDGMMDDLYAGLTDQLQQFDERIGILNETWDSQKGIMEGLNKQLSQSMNQFTSDMHLGLQKTFTLFDEELSKSVNYLSNGVSAIREGVEDLPDAVGTLKSSIKEINKHARELVKTGE